MAADYRRLARSNGKGVQNTHSEPVQGMLDPTPNRLAPSSTTAPPGNTVSQPDAIPKNILAFRLITKMLRMIPQTQPFVSKDNLRDNNDWSGEEIQEVRILNAFAHLAIADHGTVAIATNRYSTLEGPSNLGIMACTSTPNSTGGSMEPPPDSIISKFKFWNVMLAKNARYKDPLCSYPVIKTPVEPSDFSNFQSLNSYMKNLEENW